MAGLSHDELERLLEAVGQAALADTMAGLWGHILGVRPVLVAAGSPPNGDGLENVAKRLWSEALDHWVKPVASWAWGNQSKTEFDKLWDALAAKIGWTVDLVVEAVTKALGIVRRDTPDAQRSAISELLTLDGVSFSLWEEIHGIEQELLDPNRGRTDTDASFARRVRLQADLFLVRASRARSKGFAALANVDPEQADHYRHLAQESRRDPSQVRAAQRKLDRHDERLFHNASLDPEKLARLTTKLHKLNGDDAHGQESWRKSITRDARAVATGLLNASTLQYGIEQARATGTEWVKTWHATHDDRVRPWHIEADGQQVSILDPFTVGGEALDHPADFDASPENFYGCRCSMTVLSRETADSLPEALAASTGGDMTVPATDPASAALTPPVPAAEDADLELGDLPPLMWHGVITLEDTYTGDRRFFRPGAIRTAALPLPIRFQREDWGGHQGAVVVANTEGMRRYGNEIRAWGTFADGDATPEVNEVIGLMADRMMRGVSIDGDDVLDSQFAVELDTEGNAYEIYDSMRIRGATLCAIPAFDEAETQLGPPPAEWLLEGEPVAVEQNSPVGGTAPVDSFSDDELEAMLAASRIPENLAQFWTTGEGAAKIGWGTPGSYRRCLAQLGKYIGPGQLNGACANLYHRATGTWPGRRESAALETPFLLASVSGSTSLPIADRGHAWDGPGAQSRVFAWADGDVSKIGQAFLWKDPDADPSTQAAWSLGFADVLDGKLTIIPRGVAATAGGHGVDVLKGVSDADKDRIRSKICSLYAKLQKAIDDWPDCPFSMTASSASVTELDEWRFTRNMFQPRELDGPTPVTIDDDGNVFGHIAAWRTCHSGFSDMCVTPPRSRTNYAMFHVGAVRLDDGTDLPVGKLTVGAGHADPNGLGVRGATAHYDNSAMAVAVVRAAEDAHGIQVSGRIIPGTPQDKIEELRRSPISGDWRTYQGNLELIAALGVNSPGFPIPRTMVASLEGRQVALVAAGYVPRDLDRETEALIASLAARMEPTTDELDARASKLAARMEAVLNGGGQ